MALVNTIDHSKKPVVYILKSLLQISTTNLHPFLAAVGPFLLPFLHPEMEIEEEIQ